MNITMNWFFNFINISLCFLITATLSAQTKYYDVNFKRELGYMGAGVGLSVLGIVLGNNADKSSIEEIRALDRMDISRFDRGATDNFSSTAQTVSDVLLYSGATLPFITYFSKSCRSQGGAIGVMAIETFLITNGITNITKSLAQRYRPFNYNPEVPDELKLSGGSRLSFFSGHASNTAAMSCTYRYPSRNAAERTHLDDSYHPAGDYQLFEI